MKSPAGILLAAALGGGVLLSCGERSPAPDDETPPRSPAGSVAPDSPAVVSLHLEVDTAEAVPGEYILVPDPMPAREILADLGELERSFVALSSEPIIDLSHILSADAHRLEETGGYWVSVALTAEGVERLSAATAANVGGHAAVVLDGEVFSRVVFRTHLPRAERFPVYDTPSRTEAETLAARINRAVSR